MKTVRVFGQLKKYLGKSSFKFDVATPAEAVKALITNFPGLEKWLSDSDQSGVRYKVKLGKEELDPDNPEPLVQPWSEAETFSIPPVLSGSGGRGGWGQILVGVALIGAAIWAGPALGAIGTFGGTPIAVSQVIGGIGAALVLGGIAQLLTPIPKTPEGAERFESFTFSGIDNVAQQGLPVPIIFGRCFVGSAILSTSLDVDQVL